MPSGAVVLAIALLSFGGQKLDFPTGNMAVLEPAVAPEVIYADGPRIDPFVATERALDRLARESRKWSGWNRIKILDAGVTRRAMRDVLGPRGTRVASVQDLDMLAAKLETRYIAFYRLRELVGARTRGFGARVTGRASIQMRVWDAEKKTVVWYTDTVETSTVSSARRAMEPRIEQAYVNALKVSLDPFISEGLLKSRDPRQSVVGF
jgi:hypothetical protein